MKEKYLNTCVVYDDYHGPIEHAAWENFISGSSPDNPVMYALTLEDGCVLICRYLKDFLQLDFPSLQADYPTMDAVHIDHLVTWLREELDHWDEILLSLEKLSNDTLRFLVIKKIPLDTIMRFILSRRCVDRKGQKCSEKEAELAWNLNS